METKQAFSLMAVWGQKYNALDEKIEATREDAQTYHAVQYDRDMPKIVSPADRMTTYIARLSDLEERKAKALARYQEVARGIEKVIRQAWADTPDRADIAVKVLVYGVHPLDLADNDHTSRDITRICGDAMLATRNMDVPGLEWLSDKEIQETEEYEQRQEEDRQARKREFDTRIASEQKRRRRY